MPARWPWRIAACFGVVLFIAGSLNSGPAPADKPESWVEVASPHFNVMSNDGEKTARRIAEQFEQIRLLYSKALSGDLRLDPGIPIVIIAAKNEKSFSQIIPEYWLQKGHTHPAGIFLPNPERNYIALRTDVQGEFPYLTVYHEYVHLIVNLNFQHFPLWLNEGYATFLGSATLLPKAGRLGQPNESELSVLAKSKLLPLELLFRVGHDSPYYNEAEKTNVFYAESWALVHFLMTNETRQKDHQLGKYIALVERGDDPVASAEAAFGDLGRLKKELDSYVSRTSYTMYSVALPDPADPKVYPARTVPPAELDAMLGDFDVSRGQLDAAREKIEEALKLAPNSAAPQESMGLLLFRENKREEAQKYFSRAVALDSKDALAYYYDGMLLVSGSLEEEDLDEARGALEKAVALKPELAPAWDALAGIYVSDPEALDKALSAAQRAVKAMPGEPRYQYNLAVVLLKLREYDDARATAQRIGKSSNPEVSSRAQELLDQIDREQQFDSGWPGRGDSVLPSEISAKDKQTETDGVGSSVPMIRAQSLRDSDSGAKPSGEAPQSPVSSSRGNVSVASTHAYSMIGTVAAVNCAGAPGMQITLQAGMIVMHLHATDFAKIGFTSTAGNSTAPRPTCQQLRGKKARISYQLASQESWDGEISSIEMQSQP
jgi:tetratricopeptide (TPR) repeat protein